MGSPIVDVYCDQWTIPIETNGGMNGGTGEIPKRERGEGIYKPWGGEAVTQTTPRKVSRPQSGLPIAECHGHLEHAWSSAPGQQSAQAIDCMARQVGLGNGKHSARSTGLFGDFIKLRGGRLNNWTYAVWQLLLEFRRHWNRMSAARRANIKVFLQAMVPIRLQGEARW